MTAQGIKLLPRSDFDGLLANLTDAGYDLIGPRRRDHAILYEPISASSELPIGISDEQQGGHYRLIGNGSESLFSYVVGPESWKSALFPKTETLFKVSRVDGKLTFSPPADSVKKRAFIGVRACDLHAIAIQDRVFLNDEFKDPGYARRRDQLFIVAINCTRAAATCFCDSLNTGPKVSKGFDLALTEVLDGQQHFFTVEVGSEQGMQVLESLQLDNASTEQLEMAAKASANAQQQQRHLDTNGLKELFYKHMENEAYWADVAERCLNCANCTQVCPTCFCSSVEDVTDLAGENAERVRHWDSCFNLSHSHIAGGSVRQSGGSRYRQWITHKLASWQDQFSSLGCTGCGRCISWCPVGIDITAEASRLQDLAAGESS